MKNVFILTLLATLSWHAHAAKEILGNVYESSLWNTLEIPVCWENYSEIPEEEQQWIIDAVARTWEQESQVDFTGWGACTTNADGIHIEVADDQPHVDYLGKYLDGVNGGMLLNHTFANWGTSCQYRRQYCAEVIAIHEFGHALGFAHEQNRDDTPDTCDDAPQGRDGDLYVGEWDLDSVMNYCNPQWNGSGLLSDTDIDMVELFYGTDIITPTASEVAICGVSAKSDDGNVPENAIDGDMNTRWSANATDSSGQWITFEFCQAATVDRIDLAWYKGDIRSTDFDIFLTGTNGYTYFPLNSAQNSSGTTADFETFTFGETQATTLTVRGNGNTLNTWVSLLEAKIFTSGGSRDYPNLTQVTNISATENSNGDIDLTWTDTNSEEEAYLIEVKRPEADVFENIALLDANSHQYTHLGLTLAGNYTYRVTAVSGILRALYTETDIDRETGSPAIQLNKPENLTATRNADNGITLTWTDTSINESGYNVEFKEVGASDWEKWYLFANRENFDTGALTGTAYIFRVYSYGQNSTYSDYAEIVFEDDNNTVTKITPSAVAATSDDGNIAANAFDQDLETRWSANGEGETLTITLDQVYLLNAVNIAWYKGDSRQTYYRLETTTDGNTWDLITEDISSGDSLELESTFSGEYLAQQIRIIGYGNTTNTWNSITEIEIYGTAQ